MKIYIGNNDNLVIFYYGVIDLFILSDEFNRHKRKLITVKYATPWFDNPYNDHYEIIKAKSIDVPLSFIGLKNYILTQLFNEL